MLLKITNTSLLANAMLVDGQWLSSKETFEVNNPATGEIIANLPKCGKEETAKSIDAANRAFGPWQKMLARERSNLLMRWFQLVLDNQNDLASIMTYEQGKPFAEAKGEVTYAANFIRWFAEEGVRTNGDVIPSVNKNNRILVQKQPIGVVGVITPWNFPQAMITRKIAPALAVGCTCVIKPSEFTPLSAIALVQLATEAGIPDGVINLVFGDASAIGQELTNSPIVRKLSFTGSTRVGKLLMEQSASTVKKLSFELGGNAPFIIFDDANLDLAIPGLMASKFRNTGQTCVCANRIFVHRSIQSKVIEKLKAEVEKLKVGNGFDDGVSQGPLINSMALDKVEQHIADATNKGAKIETGGARHSNGGLFFQPTILSNVSSDAIVNGEETFGPVAPLIPFDTDEEVISMANDTEFGLSAYFYTANIKRAWTVAEELEVGIVGVNEGIISSETVPFGGVKQSGLGREGSSYGIDEYLEIKYILMGFGE